MAMSASWVKELLQQMDSHSRASSSFTEMPVFEFQKTSAGGCNAARSPFQ